MKDPNNLIKTRILKWTEVLKTESKNSPFIVTLISILGITQLLFAYIPAGIFVNVSILFFIIFLSSNFFKDLTPRKKILLYITIPVIFFLAYGLFLFSNSKYLTEIILSTQILLCWLTINTFVSVKDDFLNKLQNKILNIVISLLFFLITYGLIYLIAFFIDNIFNLKLEYYKSPLYRFANSISTVIGCIIFISFNNNSHFKTSNLFNLLFGKIIPTLLLPVFSLAIIYLIKKIIHESDKYFETEIYYIFAILFFFAFTMTNLCSKNKITRAIALMAGIIPILFLTLLIKHRYFFTTKYSYIGFTKKDIYIIHESILNILISAYCFYLFIKNKKIDYTISKLFIIICCLLFFPVIGYFNYSQFNTKKDIAKKLGQTNYENFKEEYMEWNERYKNRFESKEEFESFYFYFNIKYQNQKGTYLIDTEKFKTVVIDAVLTSKDCKTVTLKNYIFELSNDKKNIIIIRPNKTKLIYKIYDKLKPFSKDKNNKNAPKSLSFDETDFIMHITRYCYDENSKYESDIKFDIFFKK